MPLDASEPVVDDAGEIKLESLNEVDILESELWHARLTIERQAREIELLQHKHDNEKRRNEHLRAELVRVEAPKDSGADKYLAPVGSLVDGVTSIDQARTLLVEVTEHIGQAMQERDALLDYVLVKAPDAPEKQERERVHNTMRSSLAESDQSTCYTVTRRLRIGKREKDHICEKCGQPSEKHCSAHLFVGFYPDGRPGELFISLGRSHRTALAGGGFHLAAKLGSLALQHGAAAESLIKQMRYQKDGSAGKPFGVDGPMKDTPGVSSLADYLGLTIERVLVEQAAAEAEKAATTPEQPAMPPPVEEEPKP